MKSLPQTGTAALLEILSDYLDNSFLNSLFPSRKIQGRHARFSPAQLFRVTLLNLLTPVHSFNLLVQLLPENRSWRDFAFLPNKYTVPDAKMLHNFRDRLDLVTLRHINHHLLMPLLEGFNASRLSVAIIDSTDLPASTNSFKKKTKAAIRPIVPPSDLARPKAVRAAGLLVTKSTACDCGSPRLPIQLSWCP